MKNLILVGAGDWGLEVHAWIHESVQHGVEYNFKGFIDDNFDTKQNLNIAPDLMLSTIKDYIPKSNDVFICTIANIRIKEKIVNELTSKGAIFVNAFHKSVIFIGKSKIGIDIILSPYVVVSNNSIIGDHVGVNLFCSIGHDVIVGNFSQLSAHCDLTGHVQLGKCVFFRKQSFNHP